MRLFFISIGVLISSPAFAMSGNDLITNCYGRGATQALISVVQISKESGNLSAEEFSKAARDIKQENVLTCDDVNTILADAAALGMKRASARKL